MTKGLPYSMSRGAPLRQEIIKQTVTVRDAAVTVDGATGVGFGSVVIGDIPEGNILILGAVAYMQFTGPTSASLDDDWVGDYGIGSTPADDATITTTDINIIGSTAIAAATAEASPRTRGTSNTTDLDHILDNTDGSLEINLTLLVDDANIGADGLDFTVNGELTLAYIMLLDD
ncbi:MAG TPA: hypothetical protein VFG22_15140 [Polyangiales bacterium]|nr:hypothetical protein [Polyangiales bacterium]